MSSLCIDDYKYDRTNLHILFYIQPFNHSTGLAKGSGQCYYIPLLNDTQWKTILSDGHQIALKKEDLKSIINRIKRDICTGLKPSYITSQLTVNKIYMILFDHSQPSHSIDLTDNLIKNNIIHKPIGFVLGHHITEDDASYIKGIKNNESTLEAYIDIICACPGSGRYLLEQFILFAENNHYNAISLSALPNVLGYYPKFGFINRHSCNIKYPVLPPPRFSKTYKDSDESYLDDEYHEYMLLLRKHKFGKLDGKCRKLNMSKEELAEADCGVNGYKMRRCISSASSST